MKKVVLAIGVYCAFLQVSKAQETLFKSNKFSITKADTSSDFVKRQLKFEEVNLVSGYYFQDGNNSAITGGRGTEKLTDFANSFEIRVSKIDRYNRTHSITADMNIDRYTSASSDKIDPLTVSSASREDTHIYPSISWSVKDDLLGTTQGLSYAFSTEYDYKSHGFTGSYTKLSKDKNTEVSFKAGAFLDTYMAILPSEMRPSGYPSGSERDQNGISYKARNSYNGSISISQVINQRLQVMAMIEPSFQEGLLSTPFHRVFFTNGNSTVEKLPGTRFKLPVGLRLSYFAGDNVIIRGFYRAYIDDWGMAAHTANLEIPYKISPFFSISPFYRFNIQSKVDYFNAYGLHATKETFYTSDYDLSSFTSQFMGVGLRLSPPGGLANIVNWNSLELRYGYYSRSNGMIGHSISAHIKIK
jgi:hypothetical protein